MTEKTVNYTAEVTAQIVADYNAGESIEAIAAKVGKTTRSVVAKLSREGVYKAKAAVVKAEARVKKDELVAQIAAAAGVEQEVLDSLEKATAEALKVVLKAVTANAG
jgi:hypothetical protein